jgi:cell division septum initiation protein DivIVA
MRSHEGEGPNPKQFEVGLRGYRREPVDEYVQRLHGWLLDSETRAENAVEAATVAVGERASEILRAALAVAEQARLEAEAVKATAVEKAQAEADRLMEDARRQIDELQESIDNLAVRRANVLSELGRLQQYLAAAAPEGASRESEPDEGDDIDEAPMSAISAAPDVDSPSKNGDRPVPSSA